MTLKETIARARNEAEALGRAFALLGRIDVKAAISRDIVAPLDEALSLLKEGDPDLGKIGPDHVCKHGIRWPHPCTDCDEAAWALTKETDHVQ